MRNVTAYINYGPVVAKQDYRVINEGPDHLQIACQGKAIFVPNYVFNPNSEVREFRDD